jgi:hypothetical protein
MISEAGAGERGVQGCKAKPLQSTTVWVSGWVGGRVVDGCVLLVPELICGPGLRPLAHSQIRCVMSC